MGVRDIEWIEWLLVRFLPKELYAAIFTPERDTFSEFVWRTFDSWWKKLVLLAFWVALGLHLVFEMTVLPVIVLAAPLAWIIVRGRDDMNGLIRKLIKSIGMKWLTGQVRQAAEGKLGPVWHKVYWNLAGNKRLISFFLGIGAAVALSLGEVQLGVWIGGAAVVGMSLGFVDDDWRTEAQEDWVRDSVAWKLLANNAPMIASGAGAALLWLQSTSCTLGAWCGHLETTVMIVMAAFVHIGVQDAAWNSAPPETEG